MMGVKFPCLLSLVSHSKQVGDEGDLACDVSLDHALHLPFPDHVHDFILLTMS
jgi:hypothetical protein